MKRTIITLLLLWGGFHLFAQSNEFEKLSMVQNKLVDEAYNQDDYDALGRILKTWEDAYLKLPEKERDDYETIGNYIYYHFTCYYAKKGDTKKALETFKKSVDLGWEDYNHASNDGDLTSIRQEPQFKKLMEIVRKRGDFLHILQTTEGKYNNKTGPLDPVFSYQPVTDPNLKRIRAHFNLDSIAGKGDEISQIKNLLFWAHNTVRHDGSSNNPSNRNAIDIVEICKNEDRGVNCRMMAIMLNECYLAMGFKSRYVTCLPQSEPFNDCHVINSVFSKTLNKWVWMDPTFNAYLTDENGTLLSIAEVRERTIKREPVVLNEDANWNNQNKQTKEYYIDTYMAKNMYWFESPAYSAFNNETYNEPKPAITYIRLYPEGHHRSDDQKISKYSKPYITNNADYFWQSPR